MRSDERVARRSEKFAFYHSFERPTRHVRSDERADRLGKKFAFYERPTGTK